MQRLLLYFMVALAIAGARPSVAQQPLTARALTEQIDDLLQPAVDRALFSGIILVAQGEELLYHRPFGFANWEVQAPLTRASRLGVGSLIKPMTALLIDRLVAEGRLSLDTPAEQYIEGFPRGPEGGAPTIGQLYTHRAGTPHRVTSTAEEAQVLTTVDIVARVKQAGLLFEPGSDRRYSSAGYTVLAHIIETVEGKPYAQVLAARILGPAGMHQAMDETGRALMPGRAAPYILGTADGRLAVLHAPSKNLRFLTGAGSLYASAADLFHYLRALRRGVWGPASWDEAVDADAVTWRGWTGWTSGYEAYMDVLPSKDLTLIILTNLRSMVTWQTRQAIRALLLGEQVEPLRLPPPPTEPFEPLASVVGSYDRAGSTVEIRLEGGRLFRGDNEIYPMAGRQYFTPASGSILAFRRNEAGVVDALLSPPDGEGQVLRRVE